MDLPRESGRMVVFVAYNLNSFSQIIFILGISCDYVECKYTEWSKWSQSCGKDMVRKRTLQTIKKKGTDCTGKPKTCTGEAEQIEKKDELCE